MKRSRRFQPNWSQEKDGKYWREWTKVRAERPELDRHEFHVQIFGEDKSHVDFTNDDFDDFLAACKAVYDPGNLQAQLDALNGRKKRLLYGITRDAVRMGVGLDYVAGIVRQMNEKGTLGSSKLENLDPDDLHRVRIALTKVDRRGMTIAAPELSDAGLIMKAEAGAEFNGEEPF
jgi:hypothetical protein